ncbi:MAG: hypothetical protein A2V45_15550 [Candidatus Aminicenantes bacterium RBG_19FT_COMBO_58_17]|nr:MAG: hypothetical protein A2V45_15550 [Candidatus Aminicenantes bacterium RBG_19FT_COMBO_58_17]
MADLFLKISDLGEAAENPKDTANSVKMSLGLKTYCMINGKEGTYNVIQDGEDAIISLGYACWADGSSSRETLIHVLKSFQESQVADLKKNLIGEYTLLVKKGAKICVFSDFAGARNIFYSHDGKTVSSSFSRLEDALQTGESDLDPYKVVEFIAMRHVLYPAWLGSSTCHRRIKWLLPYEYLMLDAESAAFRIGSVIYSMDNRKQSNGSMLSDELVSILTKIVARKEFAHSKVAVSLTGGHDSRLIAAIAGKEFPGLRFRTAASSVNPNTLRDLKVARKVARIQRVPLEVFRFQPGRDEERFRDLTEWFSPAYNQTIAPLLDAAGTYALGFGGAFGTELFMELPWKSVDDFLETKVAKAKRTLKMDDGFWKAFRESLQDEFRRTQDHFHLSVGDGRDYIRLFGLINTARYGSFIFSAFNRTSYQIDPYGSYAVLDLALRVTPALWGNHRRLGGNSLVQKAAMKKVNPRAGRPLTYNHFRPMLPLTAGTFPKYLLGCALHIGNVLARRCAGGQKKPKRTRLPGGYYLSDGWEAHYIERINARYGNRSIGHSSI